MAQPTTRPNYTSDCMTELLRLVEREHQVQQLKGELAKEVHCRRVLSSRVDSREMAS